MADGRIPHRGIPGEPGCEFERTLKGEYCPEVGEVRLDGMVVCHRHAGLLRQQERAAYWRAILAHVELWEGEAQRRGRGDVVRLLECERARASEALGRASAELEESRDGEDGSGDGFGDGRGPHLWPPLLLLSLAVTR